MRNQLKITFKGDHVLVESDGEKDLAFAQQLWTDVAETCRTHNCFNVLGIANSKTSLEAVDGFDIARLFRELGIGHQYRIAWVEQNPNAVDIMRFFDDLLYNRGLPGRVFSDVDAAKLWLLGDESDNINESKSRFSGE